MSVYKPKGSKVFVMDFMFNSKRIRGSTGMRSKTRAHEVEAKRQQALRDGAAGIRQHTKPQLFTTAANAVIAGKLDARAESISRIKDEHTKRQELETLQRARGRYKYMMLHLQKAFRNKLLVDIDADAFSQYQTARVADGAANKSVNLELGFLRHIMRKHGVWERIKPYVRMLPDGNDVGIALIANEERIVLTACSNSVSWLLLPFVVLLLETGARFSTIKWLRWMDLDLERGLLQIGKDKTIYSSGRGVALSARATQMLRLHARQYPNSKPSHYVLPQEKYHGASVNASGELEHWVVVNPNVPMGSPKGAWDGAKLRASRQCQNCAKGVMADEEKSIGGYKCTECECHIEELPTRLSKLRFHDLRHTAVSRMIEKGVPLPIIQKVVGWSASTLAAMSKRYGHFSTEVLRSAVDTISSHSNARWVAPTPSKANELKSEEDPAFFPRNFRILVAASDLPVALLARFDRDKLFREVWTVPLTELAKQYRVSDGALGKTCRKLHIPTPGIGGWQKLRAEVPTLQRPELPDLTAKHPDVAAQREKGSRRKKN